MPDKEGSDDEKKSTKSVVNKKQKQMMGEEGYDIARDQGRVRPSKDKKDATTLRKPPSEEMRNTQIINTGPSAYELIKKKYKGQIMKVEELDLTKVAEAFGGYIVEAPVEDREEKKNRAAKRLAKAAGINVRTQGPEQAAATQAFKDMRMSKEKKFSDVTPDVKSGMRATAAGKGKAEPKKPTATRANYPKTRAELEAKRKEYEIDRQGKTTDAGVEKYARRTKQSNLPLSQDELDTARKRMVGTGEKGTDVGKYGGRLGRRRGSNQPTFDQVKADIDKRNPTYLSPTKTMGVKGDMKNRPLPFPTRKTTVKSGEDLMKNFLKKEKDKGKNIEDIEDDPRLKDIESDPQGREIRGKIERETGTRTRPFTRIGKTSGDIIKTDPKTGKETEVTPSGRVKPIGTLGRRAEKAQQQSAIGALGGFLAKSAVPATAGLEAAERLRKGEKGVALSAIQAMDIPYLSKAAGVLNALQTYRRGQQAAADRQSMVDVATGGGGGGRKGPKNNIIGW